MKSVLEITDIYSKDPVRPYGPQLQMGTLIVKRTLLEKRLTHASAIQSQARLGLIDAATSHSMIWSLDDGSRVTHWKQERGTPLPHLQGDLFLTSRSASSPRWATKEPSELCSERIRTRSEAQNLKLWLLNQTLIVLSSEKDNFLLTRTFRYPREMHESDHQWRLALRRKI